LYETLLNREEMAKAEDLGEYYRVPIDERDLNYAQFFSEGQPAVSIAEDYNSHNTKLLDVEGMMDMLVKLDCVRGALKTQAVHA
jgi:UDP-glucose 4-epimerase